MIDKIKFLLNSVYLYKDYIERAKNNCQRRFLAFKIILNAMSFEDLTSNRQFSYFRQIRNVFLAHKQNDGFFSAFNSSDYIIRSNIELLVQMMESDLSGVSGVRYFPEVINTPTKSRLMDLIEEKLTDLHKEFCEGFRLSNNFLCTNKNQIKEVSVNELAGVYYRYNSSKELSILANDMISILYDKSGYDNALLNFKIDYILHAVNMHDTVFKDMHNSYSIDGLYEVVSNGSIVDLAYLDYLRSDTQFNSTYLELRNIRNKLAGHMDNRLPLNLLVQLVNNYNIEDAFGFVNKLDKAVFETSMLHIALRIRYHSVYMQLTGIKEVMSFQNTDYNT